MLPAPGQGPHLTPSPAPLGGGPTGSLCLTVRPSLQPPRSAERDGPRLAGEGWGRGGYLRPCRRKSPRPPRPRRRPRRRPPAPPRLPLCGPGRPVPVLSPAARGHLRSPTPQAQRTHSRRAPRPSPPHTCPLPPPPHVPGCCCLRSPGLRWPRQADVPRVARHRPRSAGCGAGPFWQPSPALRTAGVVQKRKLRLGEGRGPRNLRFREAEPWAEGKGPMPLPWD